VTTDVAEVTDPPGACDSIATYDFTILATVQWNGAPAAGVDAWMEDRGWSPGDILGTAVSGGLGEIEIAAPGVTMLVGCPVIDYWLVAEAVDGSGETLRAENGLNANLYGALDDESFVVDLTDFPLDLIAAGS
jgi:hypothetical protein